MPITALATLHCDCWLACDPLFPFPPLSFLRTRTALTHLCSLVPGKQQVLKYLLNGGLAGSRQGWLWWRRKRALLLLSTLLSLLVFSGEVNRSEAVATRTLTILLVY